MIYQSVDNEICLSVELRDDMVWLNRNQLAELFGRDVKTIGKHINNALKEELNGDVSCVAKFATQLNKYDPRTGKDRVSNVKVNYYSMDMVLSIGYRVKSKEGIAFRQWANRVLKEYILNGYALNEKRLEQLKTTIEIMRRTHESLDALQVLNVIENYTKALGLLDDYDHQRILKPEDGTSDIYRLSYDECKLLVDQMHQGINSDLFGRERDGGFKSAIATIYSTWDGVELYPTFEEKAANLLYLLVKNHGLVDGNKRVASAVFLEYLNKNKRLVLDGEKLIEPNTLVAIVIMIAESNPKEKDLMVNLVMNFLNKRCRSECQ
nr:virulence protein RhuM/Fic/DOC family protein [Acidaminobacter sp. JC074]